MFRALEGMTSEACRKEGWLICKPSRVGERLEASALWESEPRAVPFKLLGTAQRLESNILPSFSDPKG